MPVDEWNSGGDCRSCTARPDEAYLVDGTWHDTTVSLTFVHGFSKVTIATSQFYSVPNGNNHPNTLLTASTQFNGKSTVLSNSLFGFSKL